MLTRARQLITTFTPRERRVFFGAIIVFAMTLFGISVRYTLTHTTIVPADGDIYIEGAIGQPVLINPVFSGASDIDRDISMLVFADLVALSETVTASENGRVWTATLKKELRWSDGEALTTDDVLFTLETIQDIAARSPLFPAWQGVIAERMSEREVKFTLKTPYAFFADNLKNLRIIPRHIFGNIPAANLRLSNYNLEPVGSGPYAFLRYKKRKDGFITDYILEKNPYYASTTPHITEFRFKFFTNPAEMLRAFNRFEISGFGGRDAGDLKNVTVGYDARYLDIPRYYALFFNTGLHPALKEHDVREALARGTNRDAIIAGLFNGMHRVIPVYGPLTASMPGYDAAQYADEISNPAEAQKLLDKAGWKLGADGVREKMFGRNMVKLDFDLVTPQVQFLVDAANILKNQWATIGVKTTLIVMPTEDIAANVLKTRNYQMLIFGNILDMNPDLFAFWHSTERFSPGLNLSVYENKTVDALLESIRKDMNEESRLENLGKLQKLILNDRPAIFLFNPAYLYVTTKQLKGFDASVAATPANRFDGVAAWHFRTKRAWK